MVIELAAACVFLWVTPFLYLALRAKYIAMVDIV